MTMKINLYVFSVSLIILEHVKISVTVQNFKNDINNFSYLKI